MEATTSIYEYIKAHTQDGRLPEDFSIPWLQGFWAPGARDGVSLYHMTPLQPDPDRQQKIMQVLMMMSEDENLVHVSAIFAILEELDERYGIVKLFDETILLIAQNRGALNVMNILGFGDWLLCNGTSLLATKMGLTILSAYTVPFVEEVMMECGVYDEFTYYAARVLPRDCWEQGNDELFRLAQNVHGWGRIYAVEYLQPETQEIRDWLLYEGSNNDIDPQYSANVCLQKAGAVSRLDSSPSTKEFEAIGKLIQIALGQGPRPGITEEALLPKFLQKGTEYPIDPELIQLITSAGV